MHLGELGEQIVLISERAFSEIRFIGSEKADAKTYYDRKVERDLWAKDAYVTDKRLGTDISETYMIDIMRGNIKNDNPRLQ